MKPADEAAELARLLAEEPSPLAPFMQELRSRGPDATQLASLASRLALQGIDVSPAPPKAAVPAWKKWSLPGAGGAAAVIVWLALRGPASPPVVPVDSHDARRTTEPAAALGASSDAERGSAARAGARPAGPSPAGEQESSSLTKPSTRQGAGGGAGAATAPELSASSSGAREAPVPTAARENPAPAEARATATASAIPRSVSAGADRNPAPAALPSEMQLLRSARLALRQSPAQALELAEQHARSYPQGKLTQERELMAISALVALGRRTAALARGARFEQTFPTSPYRRQVADLLR